MRILDWKSLSAAQRDQALRRPAQRDAESIRQAAQDIVASVRREGDAAVLALTEKFDQVRLASLQVTPREFDVAERALNSVQTAAIERAIENVRRFHDAQGAAPLRVETSPGVLCERISELSQTDGINRAGLRCPPFRSAAHANGQPLRRD